MGFRHAPVPEEVPHVTVDVYLELDLQTWDSSGPVKTDGRRPNL
jgi:hypothetical protein